MVTSEGKSPHAWEDARSWYDHRMVHEPTSGYTAETPATAGSESADASRPEGRVLRLGARGRLVLPAAVRNSLGLGEGDLLSVRVEPDGTITMVSFREIARRSRGILGHLSRPGASVVDELIRERRDEAGREEQGR